MLSDIITLMNQPIIIIIVLAIPTVIIFKHFFKEKLEKAKMKNKEVKDKEVDLKSVTGKIQFAIQNTDIAYTKVSNDIKRHEADIKSTNDPNAKKIFESRLKSSKQQLGIIQKILEHKEVVDMFEPIAIPVMRKIEKGIMSKLKGSLNF